MLNVVHKSGAKFMINFIEKKSNIEHYRKPNTVRTSKQFLLEECVLSVVNQYKYLGVILNEFVNFNVIADILSDIANRALGAIISNYKHINGLGYYTYTQLYNSGVCPILDYCSKDWGFKVRSFNIKQFAFFSDYTDMNIYKQLMGIWVGHLVTLEGKLQCLDIGID